MSTRKPRLKSPQSGKTKSGTVQHYNAILLEDINSKMELVIEGMEATRTGIQSDMQQMESRLMGKIDLLEAAVTAHSGEINGLKTEVQRLDAKIDRVERNLSEKIDQQNTRWDGHENRITTLEKVVNA